MTVFSNGRPPSVAAETATEQVTARMEAPRCPMSQVVVGGQLGGSRRSSLAAAEVLPAPKYGKRDAVSALMETGRRVASAGGGWLLDGEP